MYAWREKQARLWNVAPDEWLPSPIVRAIVKYRPETPGDLLKIPGSDAVLHFMAKTEDAIAVAKAAGL